MENVMWEKKVYINLWQSGMRNIPGQGINQWVYSLKIQLDTSSLRLTYTKQLNNMKKQKTFIFEKGFFYIFFEIFDVFTFSNVKSCISCISD